MLLFGMLNVLTFSYFLTHLIGSFEPYKPYVISVYPRFKGAIGLPQTVNAYLKQKGELPDTERLAQTTRKQMLSRLNFGGSGEIVPHTRRHVMCTNQCRCI